MAIRITSEMRANVAARMRQHLTNGTTSKMLAHEIVQLTPNEDVKVRIPGGISATFKRDDDIGKTFQSVYGGFSADRILSTQAERIAVGEYVGRVKASDEVRASYAGQERLGGMALEQTLLACTETEDGECHAFVERFFADADAEATTTPKAEEAKAPRVKKAKVTGAELVSKVA